MNGSTPIPDSPSEHDDPGGHVTVLLDEAVAALHPDAGGVFVDGTFGGGGHTARLLAHRPPVDSVIAVDADADAAPRANELAAIPGNEGRLRLVHDNFRNLARILEALGARQVNGVLLDLGLSSFQLDQGERGFSFRFDAPLDMRFDQRQGITAGTIVNTHDQRDLAHLLRDFGDERKAGLIAASIVRARADRPIETTGQLAGIVERAVGGRRNSPIHPATRTFQALRIAVNGELEALAEGLEAAVAALAPGGRLVVISFHSLEDRIVKRFLEAQARTCICPPDQPVCTCDTVPNMRRIGKPVRPTQDETRNNPRSRSAIMRIAERLDPDGLPVTQGSSE